jgi:hypothetical protein
MRKEKLLCHEQEANGFEIFMKIQFLSGVTVTYKARNWVNQFQFKVTEIHQFCQHNKSALFTFGRVSTKIQLLGGYLYKITVGAF